MNRIGEERRAVPTASNSTVRLPTQPRNSVSEPEEIALVDGQAREGAVGDDAGRRSAVLQQTDLTITLPPQLRHTRLCRSTKAFPS